MNCIVCKDTKRINIEKGGEIVIEYCPNCFKGVFSCNIGHDPISFNGRNRLDCPLCEAMRDINILKEELKKWRGLQQSYVQKLNKPQEVKDDTETPRETAT